MNTSKVSILDVRTYFDDRIAQFEAELQQNTSPGTDKIAKEFAEFKSFILSALQMFSQKVEEVAREVDNLEMRSRRKIILLHGIKEQKDEDTAQVITDVVKQHLKIESFTTVDIRRCHRMGRQASTEKPRPILVKFQTVAVRDSMWYSKSKLKGTGVTLSEFLSRSRHIAFLAARDKFGLTKTWTREGFVYVLGPDGKRHRIVSIGDLAKIQSVVDDVGKLPAKPTAAKTRRAAATSKK